MNQKAERPHNRTIGSFGEQAAERYLVAQGCRVLDRNWRCRIGEIDLVCLDNRELVIVEVKTRVNGPNAERLLFENVTWTKQRRLVGLSTIYMAMMRRRGTHIIALRIDVVGVLVDPSPLKVVKIAQLKGAVGRR